METDNRQEAQRHHSMLFQGDEVAAWCARWLGAQPTSVLFEVAHLSSVTGLRQGHLVFGHGIAPQEENE